MIMGKKRTRQPDSNWQALINSGKVKRKRANRSEERTKLAGVKETPAAVVFPVIDWRRMNAPSAHFNSSSSSSSSSLGVKVKGQVVALDCEMVGVGRNDESRLARVCVINYDGHVLLDSYCKPTEKITDFRTKYSGIRAKDLVGAPSFIKVQDQVRQLIAGKKLVGHALVNDLEVLELSHPRTLLRDTATFMPFRIVKQGGRHRTAKLKDLCKQELGHTIQEGEHDPYIDARAALELYKKHQADWEQHVVEMRIKRKKARAKKRDPSTTRQDTTSPPAPAPPQEKSDHDIFKSKKR